MHRRRRCRPIVIVKECSTTRAPCLAAPRGSTRRQMQNLVASVVKEYGAARATEKTIQEALAQSKGTIQSLNRKEIQLGMLEQETATNRQLYQAFLSRFKETSATRNAQGS